MQMQSTDGKCSSACPAETPDLHWSDRHAAHIQAGVTAVACGALLLWGEKIGWDNGYGGTPYSTWLKNMALPNPIDGYWIQRILPASILLVVFKFFSIEPTARHVVLGFGTLNWLLALMIPYLWMPIARALRVSRMGVWFGFVVLVLNHFVLKWSFYFTAQVDLFAYVSGLAMLYAYLLNKRLMLIWVTAAAAFVWPISIYLGFLLLVFPRQLTDDSGEATEPAPPPSIPLHCIGGACAAATLLFFQWHGGYIAYLKMNPSSLKLFALSTPMPSASEWMVRSAGLSYALMFGPFFIAISGALANRNLWDYQYWRRLALNSRVWRNFLLALALAGSLRGIQRYFAEPSPLTIANFLAWNFQGGLTAPGVFYIEHARMYGPVIFMATLLWMPMCGWIHRFGLGLSLALLFAVFFIGNPESRQACSFFTLLIPFAIKAMDRLELTRFHFWIFVALSFFMSKVWFNLEPKFEEYSPLYSIQMYLFEGWYAVHALGAVLCFLLTYCVFFAGTRKPVAQ